MSRPICTDEHGNKVVFARDTVSVRGLGSKYPTSIQRGDKWYAAHPIVMANQNLFSDFPLDIHPRGWKPEPVVEQTTAAPGEKRNVRRAD